MPGFPQTDLGTLWPASITCLARSSTALHPTLRAPKGPSHPLERAHVPKMLHADLSVLSRAPSLSQSGFSCWPLVLGMKRASVKEILQFRQRRQSGGRFYRVSDLMLPQSAQAATTKHHRWGSLSHKCLFLTILEAGSPRSE